MSNALHGASPNAIAECPRCGSRVRVAMVGRHDRQHEWEDELAERVDRLENGAGGEDVEWPTGAGDGIEPDPSDDEDEQLDDDAEPATSPQGRWG